SITSEKDRLLTVLRDEKDRIIGQLGNEKNSILAKTGQEKESLLSTLDAKNDEIEALKSVLAQTQRGFSELHKAMNKSEDEALEAYGEDCISWLRSGIKSASPEEIARYTGVSTRRLNNALASGKLKRPANNRGDKVLILVSSLIEWLQQNAPVTERQTDKIPALSNGNGHGKETINLDEYAALPV
ncbi:MAG: helix-turn-helix domain-containing protein, partial [Ktedonobacteraceae bacterium]